jgi:thiol-disulfide isomerase/thioredoxin
MRQHSLRRLFILAGLAGLILTTLLALNGAVSEARPKLGRLPKESLANNQLRMLNGRQFSLAELRGKVVVLDFFAVWCGHSKQHIPTMTNFGESDQQRGLQIIGLAVQDGDTTPDRVAKFINEFKIAYPVGMIKDPVFSDYVSDRDVSVPQTLIYGRDGRLVAHYTGHDNKQDAEIAETIRRELAK